MALLGPSLVLYMLVGLGVAGAVYLSGGTSSPFERGLTSALAIPFWPIFIPLLLTRADRAQERRPVPAAPAADELAAAIAEVDAELEAALSSLDGWAEGVLAREKDRNHELRGAWSAQAGAIRQMDPLRAL